MASLQGDGSRAAATAIAMTLTPQDHCPGVGEDARLFAWQLCGQQAQIAELGVLVRPWFIRRRELHRKAQVSVKLSEQNRLGAVDVTGQLRITDEACGKRLIDLRNET